jgi:diguanylate cyclase (GGDEF)-like protein
MTFISGTFLKSKVAQRVALLIFLAACIPALLITGITYRNTSKLSDDYQHQALVANSKTYGLSAFVNINFARTLLLQYPNATNIENWNANALWQSLDQKAVSLQKFHALVEVSTNGQVLSQHGDALAMVDTINHVGLNGLQNVESTRVRLVVWQSSQTQKPIITLVLPQLVNGQLKALYIAELEANYLWGLKEDYPSNVNVCAYRNINSINTMLFCSNDLPTESNNQQTIKKAQWDLFLRAEFLEDSWIFETSKPIAQGKNGLWSLIGSNDYIGVGILSLLAVGLLSLIQIRRTMVPLEHLITGTRKISNGQFEHVVVDGQSEFSELADAFNHMSSDIKRQLGTLQTLSTVDSHIITNLDVDHLIEQVINRIKELKPNVYINIFRLAGQTEQEAFCLVDIAHDEIQYSLRHTIPIHEISRLEAHPTGQFIDENFDQVYQYEIIQLGAKHLWVLPIAWQGAICAFLVIGSEHALTTDDQNWGEIRDLSNRIGIAINLQKREELLFTQAHYDQLTGLPNRILLDDRLQKAIDHSQKTQLPTWVVFLDLDRFKYINDSMGHHIGDLVLIEVAKRLKQVVRETDTIARFGGDEFILVLEGDNNEDDMIMALNRIISSIAEPLTINQIQLILTCSVGVATSPADGLTPTTLIKHADIAMYRAKELGKNNIQFFTETLNRKVAERIHIESLLRNALVNNEFILHYQPKVDLITMQVVGAEALIRWNSPELGFVSPIQFIHLAEETGLILQMGEWVIKTACEQAVAWQKAGYEKLIMSVNLSARQFNQSHLLHSIKNILATTGLEAQYLELELTESIVMTDVTASLKVLHEIKALGIKISVDDFGTGYSSLSYLKDLPLDTLKIDKSFTDDIVLHTDKAPIVQTIIALAKNLNLKIVAEGVESYEQLLYLKNHGCDEMQGYYFSRPKLPEEIEPLLARKPIQQAQLAHA